MQRPKRASNLERRKTSRDARWWWIGFFLTVASLVAIWWAIIEYDYIKDHGVLGILIVFTVYVISERLIGFQSVVNEHQIKENIETARDEIVGTLKNSLDFVYVGNHREGLRAVAQKLRDATHAKDTYFRMFPDRVIFGHPDIGPELYAGYEKLAEHGQVEMIISKHNLPMILNLAKKLAAIVVENRTLPQFRMFELDNRDRTGKNIPIINMTILTYLRPPGSLLPAAEVFFGWNFKSSEGIVFSTQDEAVVKYFDMWFESLKDASTEYDISRGFDKLGYIDRQTGRRIEIAPEKDNNQT